MAHRAFITGITGQDGSYLAELLLSKGYNVYGLVRRSSTPHTRNIHHILQEITLIPGDLLDSGSLGEALQIAQPDEIYNLAAQSHVGQSFRQPVATAEISAVGTLRILEAVRAAGGKVRFYQASTSELFGNTQECPQSETTRFQPRSPYGIAKLYAHYCTINAREAYNMHASAGILFNHESPRRGVDFVTRKIARGVARIKLGLDTQISLGNMDACRDWGYAGDYVRAMWLMLQQEKPDDYVIATGTAHSIRDFVQKAFEYVGIKNYCKYIHVDPGLYRPAEVEYLGGDATKARRKLGWKPEVTFDQLVEMMMQAELHKGDRNEN